MNVLAFDTSTDTLSIALGCALESDAVGGGPARIWQHTGAGGAQASATLIPALQRLMAQAGLAWSQLDVIAFGRGPGSFTGLRTACSVAQGLAFAAGVPVLPIDTLLAVAEEARFQQVPGAGQFRVCAMLDARMDEIYAAKYEFDSNIWTQHGGYSLIRPENLILQQGWTLAGNVFAVCGDRLAQGADRSSPRVNALPTAHAMLRLAPALLRAGQALPAEQALPLYIRDKVAQTTQERADQKAGAARAEP